MHHLLIDTCVWLDLAKDPDDFALLNAIEELLDQKELKLIVPRIIIDEFERNKERIINESSQGFSSALKKARIVIDKVANPRKRKALLRGLDDVNYKIPKLKEAAITSIPRIEKMLKRSIIMETSDEIKLLAAQRAIDKKAPFHRHRNSINDAIIIETYAACIEDKNSVGIRFAFVTHNKNDFSIPNGNSKLPHPDIAMYFSKIKSKYYINLAEAIHGIRPDLVTEIMVEMSGLMNLEIYRRFRRLKVNFLIEFGMIVN